MEKIMNSKHSGAVAFEYIIILVIMAGAIFVAWAFLSDALKESAKKIADFITSGGKTNPF